MICLLYRPILATKLLDEIVVSVLWYKVAIRETWLNIECMGASMESILLEPLLHRSLFNCIVSQYIKLFYSKRVVGHVFGLLLEGDNIFHVSC